MNTVATILSVKLQTLYRKKKQPIHFNEKQISTRVSLERIRGKKRLHNLRAKFSKIEGIETRTHIGVVIRNSTEKQKLVSQLLH